jgi:TPR repeat protein
MLNDLSTALKSIVAATLIASSSSAYAENVAATEAYTLGNKIEAFESWKLDADGGDASAQFQVGNMLANGDGVNKDLALGNSYFLKAAEQDHTEAQIYLATNYRLGQGAEVDVAQAVELLFKAAKKNHAMAQFDLAEIFFYDKSQEGSRESVAIAVGLYQKAAEQGIVIAQVKLANILKTGITEGDKIIVAQDRETGLMWYEVASLYARDILSENGMSKRIFPLDARLNEVDGTLREYVLQSRIDLVKTLPDGVVADVQTSVQALMQGSN